MKNKILIVIIVIILLLVGGLGYYTYFMYEKEKVTEKVDLTTDQIYEITKDFPYEILLENKDKNLLSLTDKEIALIGLYGLSSSDYDKTVISDLCDSDDINIDKYALAYNADSKSTEEYSILYSICVGKKIGLNNTELSSLDTSLWEEYMVGNLIGLDEYYSIDSTKLYAKIKEELGIDFIYSDSEVNYVYSTNNINLHFNTDLIEDANGITWIYDKNVNKIFLRKMGSLVFDTQQTVIESGYFDGDNYVLNLVSGNFEKIPMADGKYEFNLSKLVSSDNDIKTGISMNITETEKDDLLILNKNKLNNYKITFKKVDNNYQFISLEYIN